MDKEQGELIVFEEELIEFSIELLKLAQQASKAIRFGLNQQSIDSNKD